MTAFFFKIRIRNFKMVEMYNKIAAKAELLKDFPPLFFRLVLAYGFWGPAMMKWGNMAGIAEWFGSMGIPFPTLNAYLSGITEISGVFLLLLGLGTRIISVPLIFVMLVAIVTVHLGNGFEAGNNGFEIPLYYILMLISLIVTGPGKFSLDKMLNLEK